MRRLAREVTIYSPGLTAMKEGNIYYCHVTGNYEEGWTLPLNGRKVPTLRAALSRWVESLSPEEKLRAIAWGIEIEEYAPANQMPAYKARLHSFRCKWPRKGVLI